MDDAAVSTVTTAHPAVEVTEPGRTHTLDADIWAPCAYGAVLSEDTIPELGARVVCGAANNQLATDDDGERLAGAGVLYVPDFVANAGGVINLAEEQGGYDRDRAFKHVEEIHDNVGRVLERARADGITTAAAADRIAEGRLAA